MVVRRFIHVCRVIRANGGLWQSLKALYVRDDLKDLGTLVGEDQYGNKYYENNKYFLCRNRWVHYADHVQLEYDGSQVPAEWYGWLHHRTDLLPHQEPWRPKYSWMACHTENMTGTSQQYVPYSTTQPKILAWKPGPKPCPKPRKLKKEEEEEPCEEEKPKPVCDKPVRAFH